MANENNRSIALVLGSAFEGEFANKLDLTPRIFSTDYGLVTLHQANIRSDRPVYLLFRHGLPHKLLPNQINYRAQAAALKSINCGALLINSSVGVLDPDLPLYKPMLVTDLLMPDNRLPDGSTCTMFDSPSPDQGHLLIKDGLFSSRIKQWLVGKHGGDIHQHEDGLVFVYSGGPRGKTAAENRMWASLGGQVNSMTLAPEVVLANELEIPVAALVVGHKYSVPGVQNPKQEKVADTLENARTATENILNTFLMEAEPVEFGNEIYRFSHE